ncbi:3-dehydroquinate dehydratase 2 [Rubrobacter xylanophilus]|uniref:3-dehydroquinate dehydratase n=1 Tax=Rubrobacter xylanophilus TaxID=49319 RepID=A0A510HGG4_9ACTN|nr:type II 3-dehydroquinate dehydratase [Rubrobacter xylanophilus]BBL79034.1 3-dehydroquinate dehydratase 2 [Rubrobacter xylanophilus]
MARVFVLNGVNLGALGTRRPEVYGTLTLGDIERRLRERFPKVGFEFRQTDYEGEMVGFVHEARESDGIVINPGAWTHYSYALHDALEAVEGVPKVEVHLSNVHAREPWRRHSVISPAVEAVVAGMGPYGYEVAVGYVLGRSEARRGDPPEVNP